MTSMVTVRLQIRGGTGIFTGKVPFVWIVSQSGDNGMLQTTIGINGAGNTPGPFNPDPSAYRPSTIPVPGSIIPTTIEALTPNYKFPQTWKTSLGVDSKLPGNAVLTVEAIFNKDINTSLFDNVNLVPPTAMSISGYPDNRLLYPAANNVKFINPVKDNSWPDHQRCFCSEWFYGDFTFVYQCCKCCTNEKWK